MPPRQPALYRWVGRLVTLLIAVFGGARVEGSELLPAGGATIFVVNHIAYTDPAIAGWAACYRVGRVVHILGKAEVARWPVLGPIARGTGAFFVRRGEGDRQAQRTALQLLADERAIMVFPEGTRSRNGALREGRGGAALLAVRSGATLVPVALTGTDRMLVWNFLFLRRPRCLVQIGQPFHLPHQPIGRIDRADLEAGTVQIMRAIGALLPPERRGMYG